MFKENFMAGFHSLRKAIWMVGVSAGILGMCQVHAADSIPISEANYAEAETARNFFIWLSGE